jgi:hypothetical protein
MTNLQLFIAIVIPMLFNGALITLLSSHVSVLHGRITRVEDKIDLLTNKVVDVDKRVIRIEDKLGIVPR